MIVEANRPSDAQDNFQFYYSTDGTSFTEIPNAVIAKPMEPTGGLIFPFGPAGLSGTIYIQAQDMLSNESKLDLLNVDLIAIRTIP